MKIRDIISTLKTGVPIRTINNGKPVDAVVVHLDNFYFEVMVDVESGYPTGDFSWSTDPTVFDKPVRDIYEAVIERTNHEQTRQS